MWELDYKESRAPKNWCFWTVVLEKTFERPLDCKEIQPVHPKGNQSWIFTGRTDAKAETPTVQPDVEPFGHLMWRTDSFEKTLMLGKIEGGRRRGQQRTRWLDGRRRLIQWTWVWVNSRSWWRTGRPGVLQSMGLQRVGHDWATDLNWTVGDGLQVTNTKGASAVHSWFRLQGAFILKEWRMAGWHIPRNTAQWSLLLFSC